jgi:hypothetical protein
MILAINNALIVTRNKAAPITSAGDFARSLSAFPLRICSLFICIFRKQAESVTNFSGDDVQDYILAV